MRGILDKKMVSNVIKFEHVSHEQNKVVILYGRIIEIMDNEVDCIVSTYFGEFYVNEKQICMDDYFTV